MELNETTIRIDKSLFRKLTGFVDYANENGYEIAQDALTRFFAFLGNTDLQLSSLEEMEPYMRPFFVHDAVQNEHFSDLIRSYRVKRMSPAEKNAMEQKAQAQKKMEDYLQRQNRGKKSMERIRDQYQMQMKQNDTRILALTMAVEDHQTDRNKIKAEAALSKTESEKKQQKLKKYEAEWEQALANVGIKQLQKKRLKSLYQKAVSKQEPDSMEQLSDLRSDAIKALRGAILLEHGKEVMAILTDQVATIDAMQEKGEEARKKRKSYDDERTQLQTAKEDQARIQRELDHVLQDLEQATAKIQKDTEQIQKLSSEFHREEFLEDYRHYAVKSAAVGLAGIPDKEFGKMSAQEKKNLRQYIKQNARQFRTRMTRNINSGLKRKLDFHDTIKRACATNGIPLRLSFQKPKAHKAKLILILDVSGSCRAASELMLTFMSYMQEVFPGGCKTYVFTNQLYDVSDLMKIGVDFGAISRVMQAVPTKGAYSDYYTPLRQFYEAHMPEVTKDSLVMFIGDARNNKNESGADFLKAISRKAKHTYWLNTDKKAKWDQGDSIIGAYQPYLDRCSEVRSPMALISFLMSIR